MVDIEQDMGKWRDIFLSAIKKAQKQHKWVKSAEKAMQMYCAKRDDDLPVYHSNLSTVVQIQQGAIVVKCPDPVLRGNDNTTFADDHLAQIGENVLKHYIEARDYDGDIIKAANMFFTCSIGGIRINDDLTLTALSHRNFIYEPCSDWEQCDWVAFRHYVNDNTYKGQWDKSVTEEYKETDSHCVYEVWDKKNKLVWWLSESSNEVLEMYEPSVRFENFYPCCKPIVFDAQPVMFAPIVEYDKWCSLDEQVQVLAGRERALIKDIKALRFYDRAAFGDLANIETAEDCDSIPVDGTPYMANGQFNINSAMSAYDNSQNVATLQAVTQQRQEYLDKIYQVTGITQEMSSVSNHQETATAQRIKQGWGSSRLEVKRRLVHRMIRDSIKMLAQSVIQTHDSHELAKISGMELTPEIQMYIETGGFNQYTVDVETATSIAINERDDRMDRLEFVNSLSQSFNQLTPLLDQGKISMQMVTSLLKMSAEAFPSSRGVQDELTQLPQHFDTVKQLQGKLQQQAQQAQQQAQQMQGELQQAQQQIMLLQGQLDKSTEIDLQKTIAETELKKVEAEKKYAEVMKTNAETKAKEIEAMQKANEQVVSPGAAIDEQIAYQVSENQSY